MRTLQARGFLDPPALDLDRYPPLHRQQEQLAVVSGTMCMCVYVRVCAIGIAADSVQGILLNFGESSSLLTLKTLQARQRGCPPPGELHIAPAIALIVWTTDTKNRCAREG